MLRTTRFLLLIGALVVGLAGCGGGNSQDESVISQNSSPKEQETLFKITKGNASYTVEEKFLETALEKIGRPPGRYTTTGVTNSVSGSFAIDLNQETPVLGESRFTVNLRFLKSDHSTRDLAVQRQLDTAKFPRAEFIAQDMIGFPASYSEGVEFTFQLAGDFTLKGVTNPVTFDVVAVLDGDTLTGSATTIMFTSDYGFDPPEWKGVLEVTDGFIIKLEFTAKQQTE